MTLFVFALPIPEGKAHTWREAAREFSGPRQQDFQGHLGRIGLRRQEWWVTPQGDRLIVVSEGDEPDQMMSKFAASSHPFDDEWKKFIKDTLGIDIDEPPPGPMTEQLGSWEA